MLLGGMGSGCKYRGRFAPSPRSFLAVQPGSSLAIDQYGLGAPDLIHLQCGQWGGKGSVSPKDLPRDSASGLDSTQCLPLSRLLSGFELLSEGKRLRGPVQGGTQMSWAVQAPVEWVFRNQGDRCLSRVGLARWELQE